MRNLRFRKEHLPYYILAVFGALMFFMGIMNHYYFRSFVFDYGNYNFAFRGYAHFRLSPMPTYPGNFLQDHFSFLMMFFVPVYWLLNWLTGTYTLIIIQNALILVAAWYTYRLIRLKSDSLWLGAGVLLYYFVLLGRYSTFACDVNLAVMSACLIPVFLFYFEKKKYVTSMVILILALLSRENIPIWFIFIFLVLLIEHRRERKAIRFSILGIVISVLYFILLFSVFIPGMENDDKQYTLFNYTALGSGPGEALAFVVKHPVETVKMFFVNHLDNPAYDGIKGEFYLVYLVSGGVLLLMRPQYLIWFIPIVAQKVLNDAPIRWGILTYYSIEVVTLLPISVFLVIASLKNVRLQNALVIAVCLATLSMTLYKMEKKNRVEPNRFRPEKEKFYAKVFYQTQYDLRGTHRLLRTIPENASVSASENLFTHLSQRDRILQFPEVGDAEYIVFSVFDDYFLQSHMENERNRNFYLESPDWEIIGEEFPVFLLRKTERGGREPVGQTLMGSVTDTLFCDYETIDSLSGRVLFSNGIPGDKSEHASEEYAYSGSTSLLLEKNHRFSQTLEIELAGDLRYVTSTVWFYGRDSQAHIVASCGSRFYVQSNFITDRDSTGWKKLELGFWAPHRCGAENLVVYLWNSDKSDAVFFDDFRVIRRFRQPQLSLSE